MEGKGATMGANIKVLINSGAGIVT